MTTTLCNKMGNASQQQSTRRLYVSSSIHSFTIFSNVLLIAVDLPFQLSPRVRNY